MNIKLKKNLKDDIDHYEVGIQLYEEGYKISDICKVLNLNRSTFYRGLLKLRLNYNGIHRRNDKETNLNKKLLLEIKSLKALHPFWGYRRIWAYLRYRKSYEINLERIYRLMRENNLLKVNAKKLKASRKYKSKPKAKRPGEYLGIDSTKFWINGLGWVNLIVLIDWYTKEILSYGLYLRNRSNEWLDVLYSGLVKGFFNRGLNLSNLHLVSDHGSQPTSKNFMKFCKEYGIDQIFATFNNPKGNADTERVIRTIKEEVVWVNEFETLEEAKEAMERFVRFYNEEYCHSSLKYKSPSEFFKERERNHIAIAA